MPIFVGPLDGRGIIAGFAPGLSVEELLGRATGFRLGACQALRERDQRV
ncbi:MAG: hypothetical protein WBM40_09310 [Thiohalocapsa sp.]